MTIGIYCDPLRARTSANPGRGMVRALIEARPKDHFVLIMRKDYQQSEELKEFLQQLSSLKNWELHIEPASRKLLNLKGLLGFRNFYKVSVKADVFINTDCTSLGAERKPLIVTVADLSVFKGKEVSTYRSVIDFRLRRNMLKDGILQADSIVAISETTRADLSTYFPQTSRQVEIVYNGIDSTWVEQMKQLNGTTAAQKGDYLVWWGHISERKNMEGLLNGYAGYLNSADTDRSAAPSLLIIYNNPEIPQSVLSVIEQTGIGDKIRFDKRQPLQKLVQTVAQSRGLIFPSFVEGFGLPVIEAMALGVPVLTSGISAMPEVAGGQAILCDPFNKESITEGIRQLVHSSQWEQPKITARKERARLFTYESAAKGYSEIIDRLTSKH